MSASAATSAGTAVAGFFSGGRFSHEGGHFEGNGVIHRPLLERILLGHVLIQLQQQHPERFVLAPADFDLALQQLGQLVGAAHYQFALALARPSHRLQQHLGAQRIHALQLAELDARHRIAGDDLLELLDLLVGGLAQQP